MPHSASMSSFQFYLCYQITHLYDMSKTVASLQHNISSKSNMNFYKLWIRSSVNDSTGSGQQVRCIPWVQMGTFNKEINFLCGLKFFALKIFCGEYLQSSLHLMLQIWWKLLLWQMCISKHTGPLNSCLGKWYMLPYLVVPLIFTRVPLIVIAIGDDYRFAFFGLVTKLWLKFQGLFY